MIELLVFTIMFIIILAQSLFIAYRWNKVIESQRRKIKVAHIYIKYKNNPKPFHGYRDMDDGENKTTVFRDFLHWYLGRPQSMTYMIKTEDYLRTFSRDSIEYILIEEGERNAI
jgi:hypothetical protein